MVIDDKRGRETKINEIGGENGQKKGIKLKFEHTSRGSKLINLIDAFECAFTYTTPQHRFTVRHLTLKIIFGDG